KAGQSRRSRSALATSLDPPSFTEGMISSAIQRRTVRSDIPMSRAMSAARRYSARLVMIASPKGGEAVWTDRIRGAAQSLRARPAERHNGNARIVPSDLLVDRHHRRDPIVHGSFALVPFGHGQFANSQYILSTRISPTLKLSNGIGCLQDLYQTSYSCRCSHN